MGSPADLFPALAGTSPDSWVLRASGGAHAVAEHLGEGSPELGGWLLRVPYRDAPPSTIDADIWSDALGSDPSGWPAAYQERVTEGQVGRDYLPASSWGPIPGPVSTAILRQCPGGGRDVPLPQNGWLVRDAGAAWAPDGAPRARRGGGAPGPSAPGPPAVLVEIKPKHGAVSECWTVPPRDRELKRSRSRYQLHQSLKAAAGVEGAGRSEYDPRDLFSVDLARVLRAVRALRASPQNNLRVFSLVGGERAAELTPDEAARLLLGDPPASQADADALLRALALVLLREPLLPALLKAQTSSALDPFGALAIYRQMARDAGGGAGPEGAAGGEPRAATPDPFPGAPPSPPASPRHRAHSRSVGSWAAGLARRERAELLRGYLAAASARDASVLVALRPGGARPPGVAQGAARDGTVAVGEPGEASRVLAYRLSVVDLDRKPAAKIPRHAALDRAILSAFRGGPASAGGPGG